MEHINGVDLSRGSIPTGDLPDDAVGYLRAAEVDVATRVDRLDVAAARRAAAVASEASMARQGSLPALESLAKANALVAASSVADRNDLRFPERVPVEGFMGVPNLLVAIGRMYALRHDYERALDRFVVALDLMKRFATYSAVGSIGPSIYWVASRAAEMVGALAADRDLGIDEMLNALDANILNEYAPLVRDGDMSGPRGFAAVSMLRAALLSESSDGRLASLRREALGLQSAITPQGDAAKRRFASEFSSLLDEISIRLGERSRRFNW